MEVIVHSIIFYRNIGNAGVQGFAMYVTLELHAKWVDVWNHYGQRGQRGQRGQQGQQGQRGQRVNSFEITQPRPCMIEDRGPFLYLM